MKLSTKLQKSLLAGETVLIEFIKKDGSLRRAKVTKNVANIPVEKRPKREARNTNKELINLFDILKGDWICCYANKLLKVKVYKEPTPAQLRRKKQAAERWKLVKLIVSNYHFTTGEALKIASGKTVDGCSLQNLSFF